MSGASKCVPGASDAPTGNEWVRCVRASLSKETHTQTHSADAPKPTDAHVWRVALPDAPGATHPSRNRRRFVSGESHWARHASTHRAGF
jgi:hypothetical protein